MCVADPSDLSPDVEGAEWSEPPGTRLQAKETTEFVSIGPARRLEDVIGTHRGPCLDVDVRLLWSVREVDDCVGEDLRKHGHKAVLVPRQPGVGVVLRLRIDASQVVVHPHQFEDDRSQQPTGLGVFVDTLEELDHR